MLLEANDMNQSCVTCDGRYEVLFRFCELLLLLRVCRLWVVLTHLDVARCWEGRNGLRVGGRSRGHGLAQGCGGGVTGLAFKVRLVLVRAVNERK